MKVISTRKESHDYLKTQKFSGRTVGLVPTMGALHEGHLSLIRAAVKETDIPVVSLFVNPTQFTPAEDLDQYPRQEQQDLEMCAAEGVKIVFLPKTEEIYPEGYRTYLEVEDLSKKLCGKSRPHFFRGVTTVVNLLFHIIQPNKAYFGLKDRQQFLILKRMAIDLGWDIEMVGLPIVRDPDGLALSSRNKYLTSEERSIASRLYQTLREAKNDFDQGQTNPSILRRKVIDSIRSEPRFKIDYVEIVDSDSLNAPERIIPGHFIALAAYLGKARLIDNIEF